jgi:hypothetical protein
MPTALCADRLLEIPDAASFSGSREHLSTPEDASEPATKYNKVLKDIKADSPETLKRKIEDAGGIMAYWDGLDIGIRDPNRTNRDVQAVRSALLATIIAYLGRAPNIAEWIKSEINVTKPTGEDNLLSRAIRSGVIGTVKLLLMFGADPLNSTMSDDDNTPIDDAYNIKVNYLLTAHIFLRLLPKSFHVTAYSRLDQPYKGSRWDVSTLPFRLLEEDQDITFGPDSIQAPGLTWVHVSRNNVSGHPVFSGDSQTDLN